MNMALFAFSRQGCRTARRVMQYFENEELHAYTMERFRETDFEPVSPPIYSSVFNRADAIVFIGSCGIAVRKIAPFVKDKKTDPAVVVIDELGTFVIPILSGHIGGANELAGKLAKELGATPVITTATDINHKFSVDTWAARNGYVIDNLRRAKAVSAEILEADVPLHSDFPVITDYPSGVKTGDSGEIGIAVSYRTDEPFAQTLRLIPPILHLGIGCRRGTAASAIDEAVKLVLDTHKIDRRAIKCAASIDLKAGEQGLLQFCRENQWPISFYSAEQLRNVPGEFTTSEFVERTTGVDNVCERAALIGAEKLIVKKTAFNGVTVALAAEHWEVRFG